MTRLRRTGLLAGTATLGAIAVAVAVAGSTAPAVQRAATPQKITAAGVGAVKLGRTYQSLRAAGLLGKVQTGCELGGPNTRAAPLRSPLRGVVGLSFSAPRKVTDITITRGAAARGVGIGDTIADIKAAFPRAVVDHSSDEIFLLTFVKIPKSGGGRIMFGVDTKTEKITVIGVPAIAVCE